MKILISGSSYLPDRQANWPHLSSVASELAWGEYGNILGSIENNNSHDIVIGLLFVEDLQSQAACEHFFITLEGLLTRLQGESEVAVCLAIVGHPNQSLIASGKTLGSVTNNKQFAITKSYELAENFLNFYVINLDEVFSDLGYANVYDYRNWYHARMRLSARGLAVADEQIQRFVSRFADMPKKALILDCDNTLWGGVVGEVGVNGLEIGIDGLGTAFSDFQKIIKALGESGVILGLCSRNIEGDVRVVFETHPGMRLRWKDITIARVNWEEKANNLREIIGELDVDPSSVVFWDDNPIEREKVKINFPEVVVASVPDNVYEWPSLLARMDEFAKFKITDEDRKKKSQYESRAMFLNAKSSNFSDNSTFLRSIGLRPTLKVVTPELVSRAAQMTQKTTQFNFRTQKYSEQQISKMLEEEDAKVLMCSAEDKFGDHGNVGFSIVRRASREHAFLDTFLFSCRVLGRDLEFWFLQKIIDSLEAWGVRELCIDFEKTKRNEIAAKFLFNNFGELQCFEGYELFRNNLNPDNSFFVINVNHKFVDTEAMYG